MIDEKDIEKKLVRGIEKLGGLAWKFVSPGTRGVPDRIVIMPDSKVLFVELKKPGEKLKPLQEYRRRQLSAQGQLVYVIDSLEGVDIFIREVARS